MHATCVIDRYKTGIVDCFGFILTMDMYSNNQMVNETTHSTYVSVIIAINLQSVHIQANNTKEEVKEMSK